MEDTGFGESLRGGGAICFGTKAIDDFLTQGNLSYIVRAHEAHSEGVSLSKGAKVLMYCDLNPHVPGGNQIEEAIKTAAM